MFQPPSLVADILRDRKAFVDPESWDKLGLPRDTGKKEE